MRFLMVTTFYPPHHFGGDGAYVDQLSEALRAGGHEVDIVYCYDAYRISSGKVERDREHNSKANTVYRLENRAGPLSPLYTQMTGRPGFKRPSLEAIFKNPYDVVHFHNISLIGGPGILSMSNAHVTLFTSHEHWSVCATHIFWKNRAKACDKRTCFSCQLRSGRPPQLWRYTNLLTRSFAKVDHIFAPSEFTKKTLLDHGIGRSISVLPLFAPAAFETLASSIPADAPSFLYVGRITRSKGIDKLIDLFKQRPHYNLKIVGDGDLLSMLKRKATNSTNIEFLGHVPRPGLAKLYRSAWAVILPSIAPETFGLVTIEGFAQGTPAIVRNVGGAGEVVRHTGAGIVYDTDEQALAAIDALATDRARRDRLGNIAREAFLNCYTEKTHVKVYLDKIRMMVARNDALVSS